MATPRVFKDGNCVGPVICYHKSSSTKRVVHMTEQFKEKHTELVDLITAVQGWSFIEDKQQFLDMYKRSKSNRSQMALLRRKSEKINMSHHVCTAEEFLRFLEKVDKGRSAMGICKR